ncbi:MAG: hypothetical protein JRI23_05340 [Deltaproteobacteria bacterium]|nr:hypothetical protein [Deltaproteobacteria bacterium]MBW2530976.1 hypothetical protein [Deltaproteobacteria bacterium]
MDEPTQVNVRIDAEKLATQGLRLQLGTKDEPRLIELGPSGAVTGTYEFDAGAQRIRAGASHALALTNLVWSAAGGRVEITSHAKAERADVDLTIDRSGGARGTIRCSELRAAAAELWHPRLGPKPLVLRDLRAKGVRLGLDGNRLTVDAASLTVGSIEVAYQGMSIQLTELALPSGLHVGGADVEADVVRLGGLSWRMAGLGTMLRSGASRRRPAEPLSKPALRLLDHLSGKVAVDLTVAASIQSIGSRKATHRFRVPLDGGALNFKTLERGLARLEDSILDFEVEGDRLELVKDIPLVPFDRETLVYWQLDRHDRQLASRNRVKLRRLLDYRLPPSDEPTKPEEPSPLRLDSVSCDPIDITLKLRGPTETPLGSTGRLLLGTAQRAAVGEAHVCGAVAYSPTRKNPRCTTLKADLHRVRGAVQAAAVAGRLVSAGSITVGAIDPIQVTLRGLRPERAEATLADAKITGLRIAQGTS